MKLLAVLAALLAFTFSPVNYAAAVVLRCGTHPEFRRVHFGYGITRVAHILNNRGRVVQQFTDVLGNSYQLRDYRACNPFHTIAVGFRAQGFLLPGMDMKIWGDRDPA